jgi:hypothetical protein
MACISRRCPLSKSRIDGALIEYFRWTSTGFDTYQIAYQASLALHKVGSKVHRLDATIGGQTPNFLGRFTPSELNRRAVQALFYSI